MSVTDQKVGVRLGSHEDWRARSLCKQVSPKGNPARRIIFVMHTNDDKRWMNFALQEARKAYELHEVPVGAVIVSGDQIIGRGCNNVEHLNDVTAHAEIIAIGAASGYIESWRLTGATLYTTLEPCMMCAGAIKLSRIDRLVFGADDAEAGVFGSQLDVTDNNLLSVKVTGGIMAEESKLLLQTFFKEIRLRDKRHDSNNKHQKSNKFPGNGNDHL